MNIVVDGLLKSFLTNNAEVIEKTKLKECRTMYYVRGRNTFGEWEGWVFWLWKSGDNNSKSHYTTAVAIFNGLHGDFDLVFMNPNTEVEVLDVVTTAVNKSFYKEQIFPLLIKEKEK